MAVVAVSKRTPKALRQWPPGANTPELVAGDILLCRDGEGVLAQLIQAGERARYGDVDAARWSHCALVVSETEIVEALGEGVVVSDISKYRDKDCLVVHVRATTGARRLACEFALTRVGHRYDFLDINALALQALFGWRFSFHQDDRFICSGLVARATEKYIASYQCSPESMMPADLAVFWQAASGEDPIVPSFFGRLLDRIRTVARALL